MSRPLSTLWNKVPHPLRTAAIIVFSSYAIYVIAVNACLRFGAVESFVNASEDARVEVGSSYSLWPGRVQLRNFQMRFHDRNIEFFLEVQRATADVDLLSLRKRRFSALSLEGEGVRYIFRHKVDQVRGNERRLLAFPRIEGFPEPPLRKPEPKKPPSGREWTIALANVDVRAQELWFMEYRYLGDARATGAFELIPNQRLTVDSARLEFHEGTLYSGEKRPLGLRVKGFVTTDFHPANPDIFAGLTIFRQISAQLSLAFEVVDLSVVDLYLDSESGMSVTGGKGRVASNVRIQHGHLQPESFLRYEGAEAALIRHSKFAAAGALKLEGKVLSLPDRRTRFEAELSSQQISLAAADQKAVREHPKATAKDVLLGIGFDSADVARSWQIETARLELPRGRVEDLTFVSAFMSKKSKTRLEAGSLALRAKAELAGGNAWQGSARADFENVKLRIGDRRVQSNGNVSAAFEARGRSAKEGRLRDARVELERVKIEGPDGKSEPFKAKATAARIEYLGLPPHEVATNAEIKIDNVTPLLKAFDLPDILSDVLPDARADAKVSINAGPEGFELGLTEAQLGPADAKGRLQRTSAGPNGAFLLGGLVVSVGLDVRGDGVGVVLMAGENWLQKRLRELRRFTSRIKAASTRMSEAGGSVQASKGRARTN